MRPKLEKLSNAENVHSFTCYKISVPFFEFYWHFHPEYELTLILNGKGKRLVGNSIEPFEKGDMVLLGANLPHVWVSDEKETSPCEALVIQFPETFIQNLLRFPEWNCLNDFLKHSSKGLAFSNISNKEVKEISIQMQQIINHHSLSGLINLLCKLTSKECQRLSTDVFSFPNPSKDSTRLNAVLHLMQVNYLQPITLEEAAASIHLSTSAFSKFFIRKMGKSFANYLNELRITHACRLLIETDKPVGFVARSSGFENLSYFNREFLKQKKITPMIFRKIKE